MKRVIITGATGAIGTALIKNLVQKDIEVLVLTRKDSKRNHNILKNEKVIVRYCALDELEKFHNDSNETYDVFFHLAWAGAAGAGRNDMYLQNANIKYALDAVALAKKLGCHTFVGTGSQAEYGRFEGVLKADTPTFPEMGYGYAKLCAGQMTRDYVHQLGIRHIWTRILSIYGPNDGEQSMVSSVMHQLQNGQVPKCTYGEQMWDYLYSEDAAEALSLLGEKGIDGKTYVLGSGKVMPLADYITQIRDIVAPGSKIGFGEILYSEKQVMYLCADISELKNDTGWQPTIEFKEGIKLLCNEGL